MPRRRLFWRLYPTYLVVVVLCAVGVAGYAERVVKSRFREHMAADLATRCRLVARQIPDEVFAPGGQASPQLARDLRTAAGVRVTLLGPNGRVLGDSDEDPATMDNHADRPEVVRARREGMGHSERFSHTLRTEMMYVAHAVERDGRVVGIVRTAFPLSWIDETLAAMTTRIWIGGLAVAALAAILGVLVSRHVSLPLQDMAGVADRFAQGDLAHTVPMPGTDELARLAEALNRMAKNLSRTIGTIERQNRESNAVLASMVEGVIAVDSDRRVIRLNEAAADMLGVDGEAVYGRTLTEAVRNVLLERFVAQVLETGRPLEAELVLHKGRERYVLARGTTLRGPDDADLGALIVLDDLTQMRRLENVRKNFVAAASHELRTPVTAIQGFVETLRDGAIEDPEKAERFLAIVGRQAERLGHIIEDLLALSRIERGMEAGAIDLVEADIGDVVAAAASDCEITAEDGGVSVDVDCPSGLRVKMSPALMEQAVVNLLDNAIKYSESGNSVCVRALCDGDEVVVQVRDNGCGIPAAQLEDIFEPFYCVDKSRSRKLGGTGLGLAIVRHIVQVHGGRVTVESTVGKGSTFALRLPAV
jgi:two-component system phosphate regulon sensor histidine kinase PhoR